jgi:hypothetical protein
MQRRHLVVLACFLQAAAVGLYIISMVGRVTASSIFLVLTAAVLGWILWLLFRAALALVQEPPAVEAARASGRRRKELEREKQSLLKALKELEFDHEMGKISDADYREIGATYRARATRVMRALDRDAGQIDYRELVERDVKLKVKQRATAGETPAARRDNKDKPAQKPERPNCGKCSTENDADAEFCKRCGNKLAAALALLALLFCGVARAQPMMVDPSRMSGIPRPDPQVPARTITVRLIRGELANRVTDHDVELLDQGSGKTRHEKTDDQGRATFGGLDGDGPFVATSKLNDEEKVSQPITLAPSVGTRVMLVFSPGGLGQPDGIGHADKDVAPGTVVVRIVGDGGAPLEGIEVVLGQARAGEEGVRELKSKTDAKGEARFTGLDAKPSSGYMAEAVSKGSRFSGKPFRLSENMGATVVLEVREVSKDISQLSIGPGSHLILEIGDEAVQVVEVLALHNAGSSPVDVGPLHLPLPEKAVSGTVGPQTPSALTVQGHEAIWRGPIPPGDTQLQILYVLAYRGDELELAQATPLPFSDVAVVTEKIDGVSLVGNDLKSEERQLQGRPLVLYRGPGTLPNGVLHLTLTGLPHSDPTWRLFAAAVAVMVIIGFVAWGLSGEAPQVSRVKLEQRREHLLEEIAALDAKGESDPKRQKKREELADKLAKIYRELDEVQA